MADFILGRLKFVWKGEWASSTNYVKDDVVQYDGQTYVCISVHESSSEFRLDKIDNWELMSGGVAYKSNWSNSVRYGINNLVKYERSIWISLIDNNINNIPSVIGSTAWELFSQGAIEFVAPGDMLYANLSGTAILSIGDEDSILQVSSSGAPEWVTDLRVPGSLIVETTMGVDSDASITGDLAVNGGDITTTITGTTNIFNTNTTTLNLGGVADVNIGGAAKTVAVANNLTVGGRSVIDGVIYQGTSPVAQTTTDGFTDVTAVLINDTNAFSQVTHKNINAGGDASTDFIAYSDNGDNDSGWIDMGITSSGFTAAAFGLTEANDGYLFFSSPASAPTAKGNLVIATDSNGVDNDIIFATGGFATGQEKMRLTDQDHDGFNKGLNLMDDVSTTGGAFYVGPNAKSLTQNSTGYAGLTHVTGLFVDDVDDFVQFAIKNDNTGTSASTDLIAYASGGDNDSGWIDLGITSENYSDPDFTVTGPNTGYLFMSAPDADGLVTTISGGTLSSSATTITVADTTGFPATGTLVIAGGEQVTYTGTTGTTFTGCTRGANSSTPASHANGTRVYKLSSASYTGDLLIGTGIGGSHNDIIIFSGGFDAGNERIRVIGNTRSGHAEGVEILAPTESTSTTTGALRVNGGVGLIGNMNIGGNINIAGTITVSGGGSSVTTTTLTVSDPMIVMGSGNTSADTVDLGFYGIYGSSGTKYTGLVRDASDGVYKLFTGISSAPTTTVNFSGATYGDLKVGNLDFPTAGQIKINGSIGTDGKFLKTTSSGMVWADAAVTVSDDTSTASGLNLLFTSSTSGTITSASVTSTKLSFVPSTGTLQVKGKLAFQGSSSGAVTFQAPATAGSVTYTLPSADGTNGYALVTNGSGTLSWAAAGATISDDTSTNSTYYPLIATATSGSATAVKVSSSKFTFNPSSGLLTVTSLTESSSIALKDNVEPITNGLDSILKLVGVTYDRKDGSKQQEAGLIAESVNQVLPNLVSKDESGNPDGIHYSKLTAYLIEAVKTLTARIEQLEGKK